MNLYLRFFNDEVLVESADQALAFLTQIPDIKITDAISRELQRYAESSNPYPKRFKVAPKAYFIVIKTTAQTLEEFKAYTPEVAANNVAEGEAGVGNGSEEAPVRPESGKEILARTLAAERPGWYKASIKFKRVVSIEGTNKFRYLDTEFAARLKAYSTQDCYNRIIDHLRTRADIDPRSQFPSIRGRNFKAEFLGME